ncbi:MAG: phosphodiesterase [Ilumatobacteraceae bacterium]
MTATLLAVVERPGERRTRARYRDVVLVAQITDCHIVEPGSLMADRIDSAATLSAVLGHLDTMTPRPDLVVATGDLVNDGRAAQYDRLEELLSTLSIPLVPVPGNHDDRAELRRRFGSVLPAGGPQDPIDHVVDLGPLRLVLLDTQVPGRVGGRLDARQLAWLDEVLDDDPARPVIVFQHHPPFATGISFMDAEPFEGARELGEVLARHHQVELLSCGHLHRAIARRFGGTIACTWPSTCAQIDLSLGSSEVAYVDEPPSLVLHAWDPGVGVRSHLRPVGSFDRWTPEWARRRS